MAEPHRQESMPRRFWRGLFGRIVVAAIFAAVVYVLLWIAVFDAVTSALVASGFGVVVIGGSAASDTLSAILEAIGEMIGAVLGAIAAAVAAIFSIFS